MTDLNEYANNLLIEFLDEFHVRLKTILTESHGNDWFKIGVERHIGKDYFDRAREMLESPMRVVDMGKDDDELYGVEHLSNIIDGNWEVLKGRFVNRTRAKEFLGEVAEVRHNVSHRRKSHLLRRDDLVRFVQNCRSLLEAIGSDRSEEFERIIEVLVAGGSPWGPELVGYLPPHDEVVDEFVGRPRELRLLSEWFVSDLPQFLLWGYGGAGKSATAYKFGRDIQEAAPSDLQAVCWVSAKILEYRAGQARERTADFNDLPSFCSAVWASMYGTSPALGSMKKEDLVKELSSTRTLLIIDDFDTVLENEDLAEFLIFDLRNTGSKILYTSRRQIPGLKGTEIPALTGDELADFIGLRASEYELDVEACLNRAKGIESVTDGYPLFVDDLLRHSMVQGLLQALEDWSQRNGDAARAYALRKQLDHLGKGGLDVLMAVSVAEKPLQTVQISSVAGLTDDDVEQGVNDLLRWRLINRTHAEAGGSAFNMNNNTRRLVQKTFKDDARLKGCQTAYRALTGERVPEAKRAAIGYAISKASQICFQECTESAADYLLEAMTGELADSPDLYGALGWIYSKDAETYAEQAKTAFERSHRLGTRKEDVYVHWSTMELALTERSVGNIDEQSLVDMWRRCAEIGEWCVDRCETTDYMCQFLGYVRGREAKTLERINQFVPAQSAFTQSAEWFVRALKARYSVIRSVSKNSVYKGLTIAQEGLNDSESLVKTLREWKNHSNGSGEYLTVRSRILRRFPLLVGRV